ncbi:MAG: hypothetical protein ACP5JH_00135 [Bacteroidota bacterium]
MRTITHFKFMLMPFMSRQYHKNNVAKLLIVFKLLTVSFSICLGALQARASFELGSETARVAVLAPRALSLSSLEGLWANPAWAGAVRGFGAEVGYTPGMFGLRELSSASAGAAISTKFGTVGVMVVSSGFEAYREITAGGVFAGRIGEKLKYGVRLNVHRLDIMNYGAATTLSLDAGVNTEVLDHVVLSAFAYNVFDSKIGSSREPLPQGFSLAVAYQPIEMLRLGLGADADLHFPASARAVVEYAFSEAIAVNGSFETEPNAFALGARIHAGMFTANYQALIHPVLGLTHFIGISIEAAGAHS